MADESVAWWQRSTRADPRACRIADRHYNRQKVGSPQFVPPGRCVVLRHEDGALWVTSWPFAQYVKHAWAGAWINSIFRNESDRLSSDLILEAVVATLDHWPEPPPLGLISFVDASKTRRKRDPGRCYRRAGFKHVGFTKKGLWALQLPQEAILALGNTSAISTHPEPSKNEKRLRRTSGSMNPPAP